MQMGVYRVKPLPLGSGCAQVYRSTKASLEDPGKTPVLLTLSSNTASQDLEASLILGNFMCQPSW